MKVYRKSKDYKISKREHFLKILMRKESENAYFDMVYYSLDHIIVRKICTYTVGGVRYW